jgi:hypothetical protein
MNDWGNENVSDLDNNSASNGPKALRDAYEAQKQKTQELESALASVQTQLRSQAVSATLSELGIPTTAAEQYKGEADPAKIREWATTMQSIFGSGGASGAPNLAPPAQTLDPSVQQQMQSMQNAGQEGSPLGNAEAALGRVSDATSSADLKAAWMSLR